MSSEQNLLLASLEAITILKTVDPSKNFSGNKEQFKAAAETIAAHWKPRYDRSSNPSERYEIVLEAGQYLAGILTWMDEEEEWDFPNKPDAIEDYFLRVFGYSYALYALSGEQRLIINL